MCANETQSGARTDPWGQGAIGSSSRNFGSTVELPSPNLTRRTRRTGKAARSQSATTSRPTFAPGSPTSALRSRRKLVELMSRSLTVCPPKPDCSSFGRNWSGFSIENLKLAGLVEGTQNGCLRAVRQLAAYYMISLDRPPLRPFSPAYRQAFGDGVGSPSANTTAAVARQC